MEKKTLIACEEKRRYRITGNAKNGEEAL